MQALPKQAQKRTRDRQPLTTVAATMQFTDRELAQLDAVAEKRERAEAFRLAHPEYATPIILSERECAAMDDTIDGVML
jgi:predicted transcriptional regulator